MYPNRVVCCALDEMRKLLKKLDKSVLGTIDIGELLMQAFGDLIKMFQPLIKIL